MVRPSPLALALALTVTAGTPLAYAQSNAQPFPSASPPNAANAPAAPASSMREEFGRWRAIYSQLSPEGQRLVSDYLRAEAQENRSSRPQIIAARERIASAMAAEVFDADALRRILAEERALVAATQQRRHEASAAMLAKLSSADRKLVVDQLIRTMNAGREQGKRILERFQQRQGAERPKP
jgi:uncharacterized membrane protein